MDFTSIEFYTIAFCVAMVLVGFFLKQKRVGAASSAVVALELERLDGEPSGASDQASLVTLKANADGTVTMGRTGLQLIDGETVNLIATLVDDKLTIEEKKGKVAAAGGTEGRYTGHATLGCFPAETKVYVRYDSSVTGQWCTFSFKNTPRNKAQHELRY